MTPTRSVSECLRSALAHASGWCDSHRRLCRASEPRPAFVRHFDPPSRHTRCGYSNRDRLPGLQPDSPRRTIAVSPVTVRAPPTQDALSARPDPDERTRQMNNYASLCDDFGVSTYVHGKLEMPTGRETVLHFFEAVQKA